jgi:16S rRNA (guanine(1405)-N(7))-methyltransferase
MSPNTSTADLLDRLVESVLAAPKYQSIARELVRNLGAQELAKGRNLKEATKATKNRLHQVAGAYQAGKGEGAAWLERLRDAVLAEEDVRPLCVDMMQRHSSTRERLSILDSFYASLLADLPAPGALLDLACGLNPLALPWMKLPKETAYYACDIYHDQANLLNGWFGLVGQPGAAFVHDLLGGAPPVQVDVALLLKVLPVLEQATRGAARQLLDSIDAPVLIVSYPVHSLGGRGRGMPATYAGQFAALTEGQGWQIERFDFATELVYRIRR